MYSEFPSIITVMVIFEEDFLIKDYTGKLVKSMLISGNPKLERLFSRSEVFPPKPIHTSPLYVKKETTTRGSGCAGRLRAVYTKVVPKNSVAKPPTISKLKPVRIKAGKRYYFHIGVPLHLLEDVLLGLSNIEKFYFGKEPVKIRSISYEISYLDIEKESEIISKALTGDMSSLKITFISPTLLKDPLVIMRRRKKKLLLPLPEAVFSTPLLMVLIDEGKLRKNIFLRYMIHIKSVLDIPYTALKTVNLVWYVYDSNALPALIGYIKYYIDKEVLTSTQRTMEMKYGLDFIKTLSKAMVLAKIYGVGDGRATGFGHINIEFPAGW